MASIKLYATIITAVAALLAVIVSVFSLHKTSQIHKIDLAKKNDQESNWVDALVRIMETPDECFGHAEILTVRRSFRALGKTDNKEDNRLLIEDSWYYKLKTNSSELFGTMAMIFPYFRIKNKFTDKWNRFSTLSIDFTDMCSESYYGKGAKIPHEVINVLRLIARVNFANHWEYNESQKRKKLNMGQKNKLFVFFNKAIDAINKVEKHRKGKKDYSK